MENKTKPVSFWKSIKILIITIVCLITIIGILAPSDKKMEERREAQRITAEKVKLERDNFVEAVFARVEADIKNYQAESKSRGVSTHGYKLANVDSSDFIGNQLIINGSFLSDLGGYDMPWLFMITYENNDGEVTLKHFNVMSALK